MVCILPDRSHLHWLSPSSSLRLTPIATSNCIPLTSPLQNHSLLVIHNLLTINSRYVFQFSFYLTSECLSTSLRTLALKWLPGNHPSRLLCYDSHTLPCLQPSPALPPEPSVLKADSWALSLLTWFNLWVPSSMPRVAATSSRNMPLTLGWVQIIPLSSRHQLPAWQCHWDALNSPLKVWLPAPSLSHLYCCLLLANPISHLQLPLNQLLAFTCLPLRGS